MADVYTYEQAHRARLASRRGTPVHPEGKEVSETDEARVSRYEAGADPTPRDEAAQATPGQAWHELLNMTEGVRLRRLGDLLMAAGSVMGLTISREFQADMAAGWKARADAAEAQVERLKQGLYPLTQWTIEQATQLADGIGTSEGSLFVAWINERKRADAAEAQVERLTRECLDREATETDARERLRQAEERLADAQGRLGAVEALWDVWCKRLHSKHADGNEGEDCVHCMADDIHEAMWGERD